MKSSRWWMGVCCALCTVPGVLATACSDGAEAGPGEAEVGTVKLELGGIGSLGNRYRLRAAEFAIDGPEAQTLQAEDFLGEDQVELELRTGAYTIALGGAWFLERLTPDGYRRVEDAELVSDSVLPFDITADSTTLVMFQFRVGAEIIDDGGTGKVVIGVGIEEEAVCGNGEAEGTEECDDANADPCDGCAGCRVLSPGAAGPTLAPALIDVDTIWCEAQSPVQLSGQIVVSLGATLFLGPGVLVEADDGAALRVEGGISLHGSPSQPVTLTSASATPVPGAWEGVEVTGAIDPIVEHVEIEFAVRGLLASGQPTIRDSLFQHNLIALHAARRIENCVFLDNEVGVSQLVDVVTNSHFEENSAAGTGPVNMVTGSTFVRNGLSGIGPELCTELGCRNYGVAVTTAGNIEDSTFLHNDAAIPFAHALFGVEVIANNIGVLRAGPIRDSLIADNLAGTLSLSGDLLRSTVVRNGGVIRLPVGGRVQRSTLCNAGEFELVAGDTSIVDGTENFWCSTDPAFIAGRIFDSADFDEVGPIVFEPFLTEAPLEAPADPGPDADGPPGGG